jgi:hypothetical protein
MMHGLGATAIFCQSKAPDTIILGIVGYGRLCGVPPEGHCWVVSRRGVTKHEVFERDIGEARSRKSSTKQAPRRKGVAQAASRSHLKKLPGEKVFQTNTRGTL